MTVSKKIIERFRIPPGQRVNLKDHDSGWAQTKELRNWGKRRSRNEPRRSFRTASNGWRKLKKCCTPTIVSRC